ncbi:MAG: element excision factor XisH family protein [Spirulinaceae cyanobacterium]
MVTLLCCTEQQRLSIFVRFCRVRATIKTDYRNAIALFVFAKDVYRDRVKIALQKEDWLVTHDPLLIELSSGRLEIDK